MSEGPLPGEYDEAELRGALERLLAEAREGRFDRAYGEAIQTGDRHGELAAHLLLWITGSWADDQAFAAAVELLHGPSGDPRREKVSDMVRRLAAGEITWTAFLAATKKGLIRRPQPARAAPSPGAVPLSAAQATLAARLAEANLSIERPHPIAVWTVFKEFARRPVAATPPLHVEDDSCLFQWGVYDWGDGRHFEWDFTRQFVLYDDDGDYDHMEQLQLTLLFDAEDPDLTALGTGEIWAGSDIDAWVGDVEALGAFSVPTTKAPVSKTRLLHTDA